MQTEFHAQLLEVMYSVPYLEAQNILPGHLPLELLTVEARKSLNPSNIYIGQASKPSSVAVNMEGKI
jgi:hypothetical protein